MQVVAPDAVLRELGEACSGGEPFLYAHATAAYSIADGAGKVVTRGALPEGEAVAAFNHDPGVDRVPTFCSFSVHGRAASRVGTRCGSARARRGRSRSRTARAMVVLN